MNPKARYILAATFLAGILDIGLAFLNSWLSNGTSPSAVLKFVASGLVGNKAFSGPGSAGLYETIGMLLHFLITFLWVIGYFLVAPRFPAAARHWIIAGLIYGVLVFLVMNLVVVPISGTPKFPFRAFPFFKSMVIQVIGTGWPISRVYSPYAVLAGKKTAES